MEIIIAIITTASVVLFFWMINKNSSIENISRQKSTYKYSSRKSIMSSREVDLFIRLNRVAGGRYYVFPQVHLSALLDHKIKGQNWHGAFRHINGKSVDYVFCDKTTLRPVYAIELDDRDIVQKISDSKLF